MRDDPDPTPATLVIDIRGGSAGLDDRTARVVARMESLRVSLVTLAPGGELPDHRARGPISIQPLEGRLVFTADGVDREVGPGELLFARGGLLHSVASTGGVSFLLTVALPPEKG